MCFPKMLSFTDVSVLHLPVLGQMFLELFQCQFFTHSKEIISIAPDMQLQKMGCRIQHGFDFPCRYPNDNIFRLISCCQSCAVLRVPYMAFSSFQQHFSSPFSSHASGHISKYISLLHFAYMYARLTSTVISVFGVVPEAAIETIALIASTEDTKGETTRHTGKQRGSTNKGGNEPRDTRQAPLVLPFAASNRVCRVQQWVQLASKRGRECGGPNPPTNRHASTNRMTTPASKEK